MYFQFLIEDQSGDELVKHIMEKLSAAYPDITYNTKWFHGIGGFVKGGSSQEAKKGKLLTDLAIYLSGFNKSLQGIPAAIVVILDNDTRNTEAFLQELEAVAENKAITIDHVFCIAVEEMEAWLLGDRVALLAAYPSAKLSTLNSYVQDSICGTWEVLAEAVYPGGLKKFNKDCPTYREKGKYKSEWARMIGQYMELNRNESPSFQSFIDELNRRVGA